VKTEPNLGMASATRELFQHVNVEDVEGFDGFDGFDGFHGLARKETPRDPFASSVPSGDANTAFLSTVDEYR
jgi:hypothetical protein